MSRERMVVEIRDWCQNVGEYNTYNFCIWHFGLCVIVSKIDRCRSSDPPYQIAINPWWRGGRGLPSLIALFIGCNSYVMRICTTILCYVSNVYCVYLFSQMKAYKLRMVPCCSGNLHVRQHPKTQIVLE